MSRAYGTVWISGLLALSLAVTASHAQSGTTASLPAPDSVTPAPDSAPEEGKKKGGLFGKAKKFVGNKAVQQVAEDRGLQHGPRRAGGCRRHRRGQEQRHG